MFVCIHVYTHRIHTRVCVYINVCTHGVYMCIFACMYTEFTRVCVCIYVYGHRGCWWVYTSTYIHIEFSFVGVYISV